MENKVSFINVTYVTIYRRLEPGVCILLHYNEMQDGNAVDEATNAKYDTIIVPYSSTII